MLKHKPEQTLLVLDTATESCSVALWHNQRVYSRFEICPQQHSQRILPMIQSVCDEADITLKDLDVLGFGRGPGSFTGVRIAIATIQGLAFGLNVPVVGVSTLLALAQEVSANTDKDDILVAIDARMNEVYFAHYKRVGEVLEIQGQECVVDPQIAQQHVRNADDPEFAGTGWQAYEALSTFIPEGTTELSVTLPNAKFMLPEVEQAIIEQRLQSIMDVQPVYLRDTVTWKKLPGRE
ncbi:tRNA (adenosine(37)-N6)-threonylcarbamoyltransferase complex dimerization subunit type 1 TsaB [Alteromonas sp. ASW11-36]|uniref:tRNA threonylcarbamoyladenosine biosynthesis protein TsaB n=1 Tax=Alteromonas arenosi TaxID=3055817 RepID=A0ABT7SVT5_9ALTE|nr:tRNA (adenosine(37)-N6)-threonylcarbamoyltransferase complex dimerization subunit type 1 TsaB [Alteromonas sp. ASW11-36]MDM7860285.1 tRNA (adenosine(37)-N6)-threonylcarbamoyltransferase complex dimerization subunit type 1 TsaB [Alteromonas sp. ASW11-36]